MKSDNVLDFDLFYSSSRKHDELEEEKEFAAQKLEQAKALAIAGTKANYEKSIAELKEKGLYK